MSRPQLAGARSLDAILLERLRTPLAVADRVRGRVAFDVVDATADEPASWTIDIDGPKLSLSPGIADGADTTISADLETMMSVLDGSVSGIEAFVQGDLQVRGNLALSLWLSGAFERGSRPASFPRAASVMAGGIDTFYLEAGEGPPVVLLHGLGATNSSMLPTLSDLAKDHHVFAPDLPGFGDSGKPITKYDAEFFSTWLLAFLDAIGVEKAHIVGNSLGGRIAVETALRAPARVDRLALLAPSSAFIKGREFVRLVQLLRPELAFVPVPLISRRRVVQSIRAMFSSPKRLPPEWYESAADEFLRVFKSARGRIAFFSAACQIYLEKPYGERGFWDRLPELSPPSLFIWGKRDRVVPARFANHVTRCLPNATSIVLPDCGHVPQYELPEKTHGLIREFFETGSAVA
jgi:pimeloyl-ACP methyl ester carboxylesterase